MNGFTAYAAQVRGDRHNKLYPLRVTVEDLASFKKLVQADHVLAAFTGAERGNDRFIRSDCVVMDVDNSHSEEPSAWARPETIAEWFPGVSYWTATSRNNMKEKGGSAARPRFHVYFPIASVTSVAAYKDLKLQLASYCPVFDPNAIDAARFIYGTEKSELGFVEGETTIDVFLSDEGFRAYEEQLGSIPEGQRNNTLSLFAGRVLHRLGDCERAREAFGEMAARCQPPLEAKELDSIWASALRFHARVSKQPGYKQPEEYGRGALTYKPSDYSDLGQAQVLAQHHGGQLRYSPAFNWMVYNGQVWEESQPRAQGLAQSITHQQLEEAEMMVMKAKAVYQSSGAKEAAEGMSQAKFLQKASGDQRAAALALQEAESYLRYVLQRRNSKQIAASLTEARPLLPASPEDFDKDPYTLNTPAGVYDLREPLGQPKPHAAEQLLTKMTNAAPLSDEKGRQLWAEALDTIFCGDQALIGYVQRVCGLAAIGRVMVEALIIAYGDGRNGKSTFWNVISRVLGSYSGCISADVFTANNTRNVKPELAETKGKRMLIASELEEGMRLSTASVKHLCSTDLIRGEKKYKDPFDFVPSHTIVLYTNHLPRVGSLDAGTWRRLIVIPFEAKIEGAGEVKNYGEYLYENAGGAILAWVMEGARLIHQENYRLKPPAKVQEATGKYKEASDWFSAFLMDCCEVAPELSESSGQLYEQYRYYAKSRGEYVRSTTDFYAAAEAEGFERRKTKKGIKVRGLELKAPDDFIVLNTVNA